MQTRHSASCAIAIASFDSDTVSIAAEIIGTCSLIFFDIFEDGLQKLGWTLLFVELKGHHRKYMLWVFPYT